MATKWRDVPLGELFEFRTGKLDSNAAVEQGTYPFFTCSPQTLCIDTYAFDTEAILLAGNNANGVFPVKYYKGKFNAYQRTYVITPRDGSQIDCRYAYYQMKVLAETLKEHSIGSATRFLTMRIFNTLTMPVPTLSEQRAIASILGSLDDKIELNRRMNATLEEIARALFKSWFVDFDPVRAKMEGRQSEGIDAETAALFPDRLVESELGLIPEGWRVGTLGDLGKIVTGKTPSTQIAEYFGGNIPFITPRDMDGTKIIVESERYLTEAGADSIRSSKIDSKSIAVSCIGSDMGKVAYVGVPAVTNQQINTLVPFKEYWLEYIYHNLHERRSELRTLGSSGSAIPILNKGHFSQIKILQPADLVLKGFHKLTEELSEQIEANIYQSRTLAATRDALLPKLLSGEVHVEECG